MSFDPADERSVAQMREWCKSAVRGETFENALVMMPDGSVWVSHGGPKSVNLDGLMLDDAIIIHNHPEFAYDYNLSFGNDDFKAMVANPGISELWACTTEYDFFARPTGILVESDYSRARDAIVIDEDNDPDFHHMIMEGLRRLNVIDYRRTRV